MASDTLHKQEFRLRDLTTRSVLLFPTRAQIIRDINHISLQPGSNQVMIDGIDPTVDKNSIKFEITGSAIITEVTVDLLPNREIYEDIYPSDSDDDFHSSESESDDEVENMTALNNKIKHLNKTLLDSQEKVNSAATRLQICDNFGKSLEKDRPPPRDLENVLNAYENERAKIYADHQKSTAATEQVRENIKKVQKEKVKLARELVKANEKKEKEKARLREKRLRKRREIEKEKQRIRSERESFWPKKVYRVTINIEPSSLTPSSSRRSSIDGDTIVNLVTSDSHEPSKQSLNTGETSLSLSYITYSASWSPRYDLSLNSIKGVGSLDYGAELKNTTSETWRDAKVILSTSQTNFAGLSETIPILNPWHVRLVKISRQSDSALFSQEELHSKQSEWQSKIGNQHGHKKRAEIFGNNNSSYNRNNQVQQAQQQIPQQAPQPSQSLFGSLNAAAAPQAGGFGSATGGLFGGAPAPNRVADTHAAWDSSVRHRHHRALADEDEADLESDDEAGTEDFDEDSGPQWEESGMTTTYDVPGLKILAPSNSTTKHKIARVDFKNIVFSYIVIGKLRQVAFLKARIRNSSKISLLKGPLGLTLDGSFLGQASLPRCSAGESFSLPLGVDPAISIMYPKPTVRRSQSGIFSKEDSNVFTRTMVILNTKHNAPVELTVIDQVPVSEDERLRIEIVNPRGLKIGVEGVKTGTGTGSAAVLGGTAGNARASVYANEKDGKWGSAVATARKAGQIDWHVKLNAGQGVRLTLEYETISPGGEVVIGV